MSKEYGLIIPNKKGTITIGSVLKKPSIFEEDSDSDRESAKPTGFSHITKRQDRVVQEKAVEEDPTVFQYDEIYDAMDEKRKQSKLSRKDLDKKPKYISKLLVAADRRKREHERRIERTVQKEREAEGEEFKDKESFVTSAYKKKLEEMSELEEQEKREDYLESIGDVRKQGNLDGFYRHLYDQKVNNSEIKKESNVQIVETDETKIKDVDVIKIEDSEDKKLAKKRKYRKRDESDSGEETETRKSGHLQSNLDADSDFSIDSGSDSDEDSKFKKPKVVSSEDNKATTVENNTEKSNEVIEKDHEDIKEVKEEKKIKKPKIDVWKKRTVGVLLEDAIQRYFERKALRESG